jgi:hypothetical protein
LQAQIDEIDAKLSAWHRADEGRRRFVKSGSTTAPAVAEATAILDCLV